MKFSMKQKALAALSLVAFSYALLNVSIRFMNAGFEPFSQVYLRIALGLLLTAVVFRKRITVSKILKTSPRDWLFLILMGTLGYGLAVDAVTHGVLLTNLLNVAVISSTTPFFVFLFTILVLRKKYHHFLLFFLILTFYGVLVLATNSLIPSLQRFGIGDFYVLLFAIGLGVYIISRKALSKHLNTAEISVVVMFVAFLSSFITALLARETVHLASFFNPVALFGLFLGGVLNLVATIFENFGFQHIDAVTGSQMMLLENVFSPILGFILFHETILPIEFVGALLVIVGVWFYTKYSVD